MVHGTSSMVHGLWFTKKDFNEDLGYLTDNLSTIMCDPQQFLLGFSVILTTCRILRSLSSSDSLLRESGFCRTNWIDFSMAKMATDGCAVYFVFSTFRLFQILYR